jgi:hypothetical protein
MSPHAPPSALQPPALHENAATEVRQLATHDPATQQPPLQAWLAEHDAVHVLVEVLHACPVGQLVALVQ